MTKTRKAKRHYKGRKRGGRSQKRRYKKRRRTRRTRRRRRVRRHGRRSRRKKKFFKQHGGTHHHDDLTPQEAIYAGIKQHWEPGVQQAIRAGAKVNQRTPYSENGKTGIRTPLIAAVQHKAPPGIFHQILGNRVGTQIDPPVDAEFKDPATGKSAAELAEETGQTNVVSLIKKRSAADEAHLTSHKFNKFGMKHFPHDKLFEYNHD